MHLSVSSQMKALRSTFIDLWHHKQKAKLKSISWSSSSLCIASNKQRTSLSIHQTCPEHIKSSPSMWGSYNSTCINLRKLFLRVAKILMVYQYECMTMAATYRQRHWRWQLQMFLLWGWSPAVASDCETSPGQCWYIPQYPQYTLQLLSACHRWCQFAWSRTQANSQLLLATLTQPLVQGSAAEVLHVRREMTMWFHHSSLA